MSKTRQHLISFPAVPWFDSEVKKLLAVDVNEVISDARERRRKDPDSEGVSVYVFAFGGLEMHFVAMQRILRSMAEQLDDKAKALHAMHLAAEDVFNTDMLEVPTDFDTLYEVLYVAQENYLRMMGVESNESLCGRKLVDEEL